MNDTQDAEKSSSLASQLWVEPMGDIIVARVRGIPTKAVLKECHERILLLVQDTEQGRILIDCLEMEAPPVEVPMEQWNLDKEIKSVRLRRAIVVPNTRLAYLARIAFAEGDYRVFYNDLSTAVRWLSDSAP